MFFRQLRNNIPYFFRRKIAFPRFYIRYVIYAFAFVFVFFCSFFVCNTSPCLNLNSSSVNACNYTAINATVLVHANFFAKKSELKPNFTRRYREFWQSQNYQYKVFTDKIKISLLTGITQR